MTTMPDSPQIDFYSSATSPKASATTTIEDLIEAIQGDEFAAKIGKLRAALDAGDDDRYAVAKRDLQAVSVSGTCDGKRAKAIEEGRFTHSGFLQLDFDAVDNIGWSVDEIVEILQAEPRIVAAFISPSGHGVKGIARIPVCQTKDEHAAAFAAARNHFRNHNLVIDEACKDPVRLMFVSHDPNAWIDMTRTAAFECAVSEPELPAAEPAKSSLVIKGTRNTCPPPPQHGIHTWLMQAAWWCRIHGGLDEQETVDFLQSHDGQLRRALQPTEAIDAARNVFSKPLETTIDRPANAPKETPDELLARAYALQFDPAAPPPPDEVVMVIDDIPIAARGNLTAIQGKSKVGKSAVISAVLGAAIRGQQRPQVDGDTLCLGWREEDSGSILHIDTEQSRSDWFQLVVRGIMRSGIAQYPPRLRSLPLIPFTRNERLTILKLAMAKEKDAFGKIDAVILDGIADLCSSPNDEAEALDLVGTCMALAQEYHCPIFCVLHENPGTDSGKTRGHLGSELNRKAFANLRIDKDAETSISTIYGSEMRKRDIPREQGFCFGWDDAAKMHVFFERAGEMKNTVKAEKTKREALDIFPPGRSIRYADAIDKIMAALDCSKSTAKRKLVTYETEGIIFKTGSGDYMRNA